MASWSRVGALAWRTRSHAVCILAGWVSAPVDVLTDCLSVLSSLLKEQDPEFSARELVFPQSPYKAITQGNPPGDHDLSDTIGTRPGHIPACSTWPSCCKYHSLALACVRNHSQGAAQGCISKQGGTLRGFHPPPHPSHPCHPPPPAAAHTTPPPPPPPASPQAAPAAAASVWSRWAPAC